MDFETASSQFGPTRHKCFACHKQFNRKEHLVEHMKISFHSVHQPRCEVCQKHCKSFESLKVHLIGPQAKKTCLKIFSDRGCSLCLKVFDSLNALNEHIEQCRLTPPPPIKAKIIPGIESQANIIATVDQIDHVKGHKAVAMDCEMVGGGNDSPVDLCARVCIVDEEENIIFHTYVQPQVPVTDYRLDRTGLTEQHLRDAMPLEMVRQKLLKFLHSGESSGGLRPDGQEAILLVGHGIKHDLHCLRIEYPVHLLRDTAKYPPLLKTNLVSHSLRYLTQTYLGYDIQLGVHDPYEDCVSAMRLYKRMCAQDHQLNKSGNAHASSGFDSFRSLDLEKMTPDELYEISASNYRCWCLDERE